MYTISLLGLKDSQVTQKQTNMRRYKDQKENEFKKAANAETKMLKNFRKPVELLVIKST